MEITNTNKLTAEQIVQRLNSKGYLYYGESARAWNGKTQARIYFGRDFVTILPNGTITNDQSGKRTLTIGDAAIEAIQDIVTPATAPEAITDADIEKEEEKESVTINTTTGKGTDVIITITAENIIAEFTLPKFGKIETAVTFASCRNLNNRVVLLGKTSDGLPLYIDVQKNIITETVSKQMKLKDQKEEKIFPGITTLRELQRKWDDAWEKREKALEDNNANPGQKFINAHSTYKKLEEARAEHPRATLALKAESYIGSGHVDRSIAGKKALELLKNGGSTEEAQSILDNWLSKEAMWD